MKKTNFTNDYLKKYKIYFIVSLVILGVAASFLVMGIYEITKDVKVVHLNDLITQEDNKYKNTYLDVHYEPYVFAGYDGETSKFYIVQDDEYMYIAYLPDFLYDAIMNQDLEKQPYDIMGHTKSVPDDVKKLAIEAYNEEIEDEAITDANFESYFGSIYIDTTALYNYSEIYFTVAVILIIIGIICLYNANNSKNKAKKTLNKLTKKNNKI